MRWKAIEVVSCNTDLSKGSAPKDQQHKVGVELGMRVVTQSGHEGTIAFVGPALFAPGLWVGVELDGPYGRSDGSFHGEECFHCKPNHGLFVRPSMLREADCFKKCC